jgi:hypothetical protein
VRVNGNDSPGKANKKHSRKPETKATFFIDAYPVVMSPV